MNRRVTTVLILLLANGGGAATAEEVYRPEDGPYRVVTVAGLNLHVAERGRQLQLRVSYPEAEGTFPLIVFHHGALCTANAYGNLADRWAAAGYVVVLPFHPPSGTNRNLDAEQQQKMFMEHVADMSSMLDSLDAIADQVPGLRNAVDATRVAAAGHSMGALIATIVSGLPRSEADGRQISFRDERFDVAVLLSGPGPLPRTPDGGWDAIMLPLLATTGTRDHANRGGPGATWEWRLGAFELTPPGDKYALVIDEADHFLGGMICPDRAKGPKDEEAFAIVASVSTAFLDAYLKESGDGRKYLDNDTIASATDRKAELRSR